MKRILNKKIVEAIFTNYHNVKFTEESIALENKFPILSVITTCEILSETFTSATKTPILEKDDKNNYILKNNSSEYLYALLEVPLREDKTIVIDPDGHEYVYLYYYDSYKALAEYNDVCQWPCKIGQTRRSYPMLRIMEQLNESTPEIPVIPFVIKCRNALAVEQFLHNHLKISGKSIPHPFNKEWFNTNQSEIEQFITNYVMTYAS